MSETTPAAPAADHGAAHHVNYLAKFYWLVGLTITEVAVALKVEGTAKLVLLAVLSVWKAGIVLNHFMHMKAETVALKLAMCFPLVLIFILLTLFLTDSHFLGYAGT
jgi:cytochrome c oxidase subunit IV